MILTLFSDVKKDVAFSLRFFQATLSIGGLTNYAHRYRQTAMTAMQAVMAVY